MSDLEKHVEALIQKAVDARLSDEAMKYAQAALNAANTILTLKTARQDALDGIAIP